MNRIEFDSLQILEQIKYINIQLENGLSLGQCCRDINIPKSTLRNRFNRNNYKLIDGSYISIIDPKEINEVNDEHKEKSKCKDDDIEKLILKINGLEKKVNKLAASIENNKREVNTINHYGDITESKSFKIAPGILENIQMAFEKYSEYKKQDIINTILDIGLKDIL